MCENSEAVRYGLPGAELSKSRLGARQDGPPILPQRLHAQVCNRQAENLFERDAPCWKMRLAEERRDSGTHAKVKVRRALALRSRRTGMPVVGEDLVALLVMKAIVVGRCPHLPRAAVALCGDDFVKHPGREGEPDLRSEPRGLALVEQKRVKSLARLVPAHDETRSRHAGKGLAERV